MRLQNTIMIHRVTLYYIVFVVVYLLFYLFYFQNVLKGEFESKFLSGDAYTYSLIGSYETILIVVEGVKNGGVHLGSISSLIGVSIVSIVGKSIFGSFENIFYLLFNHLLFYLFIKNILKIFRINGISVRNNTFSVLLIVCNPMYINYLTGINKEIISLLYLSGLMLAVYKKDYKLIVYYTIFSDFFIEIYIAIS